MNSIDFLEHGGAGEHPFAIMLDGYVIEMPNPREMHYQDVLMSLGVGHVHWTPGDLPDWKRAAIFERWCAAWDLPSFTDARRLAYLVDHYRAALSSDLTTHAGVDLGDLWRARRWTKLLDLIDRLPSHSWYSAAVANDEEHAEMVAKSAIEREKAGETVEDNGPSLTGWTPEVAAITRLTDAVNGVRYAVIAVQAGKKAGEPPKPERRPVTAIERAMRKAKFNARKTKHESLVARVLPHKAAVK